MFRYIGGKAKLAGWIVDQFPEGYQSMDYVEPFGGAGWVLLQKDKSTSATIYNDLNPEMANVWRQIKKPASLKKLARRLDWLPYSRELFDLYKQKQKNNDFVDDEERALAQIYLQCTSFSGKGARYGFAVHRGYDHVIKSFVKRSAKYSHKLEDTVVEELGFEECIQKYDSPNTLMYLDPPYLDREFYYYGAPIFTLEDHTRLSKLLQSAKGKWVLSYYPDPRLDPLYLDRGYTITYKDTIKHSCGITRKTPDGFSRPAGVEMLVRNY